VRGVIPVVRVDEYRDRGGVRHQFA
jgi:hypothetical protein